MSTVLMSSACPLDCPDTCSLSVEVMDGRVHRVTGSEKNPLTQGFICSKVRKIKDHLYGEERLRYPMLREGAKGSGQFRRITWEEALDRLTAKLSEVARTFGGEAILPFAYGGSNGHLTHQTADARLFRRLGASRILRTLCAMPSGTATRGLYGSMPGVALDEYPHSRLIVLWGVNPSATGIHLVPVIREAISQGAKLVVVDPRRIPLALKADVHLALRPGTDLPVALSVIDWLFRHGRADEAFLSAYATGADTLRERASAWPIERAAKVAGLEPAELERFAALYAETNPAVIRCGWGSERNRNGGSATAAILALPAVAGKFRVRGGGFTMSNGESWGLSREPAVAEPEPPTRAINMVNLGRALLREDSPPVKLLFVYNCNPLATVPDQNAVQQGLLREDLFTVVFDQVHTDTARYADLLLPATAFLEHRELRRSYGAMCAFDSHAVAQPEGEARPNYDVFVELCRRLGLSKPGDPETADEMVSAILAAHPHGERIRRDLAESGVAKRPPTDHPIQFVDVFPDGGKIHLVPEALEREAPLGLYGYAQEPADEAYPLALISPALGRTISSTFGQLIRGEIGLALHPDDARARGIGEGDRIRVFNALGEVLTHANITDEVRPGVVLLPKGLWRRHTQNGATANALIPDTIADLGGGACYNDARVEVARA